MNGVIQFFFNKHVGMIQIPAMKQSAMLAMVTLLN